MKKFIFLVLMGSLFGITKVQAQSEISAGVSLFVGKNGNYGLEVIPIPTQVNIGFGGNTSLHLGYSLYYMSGMSVKDFPFEMDSSPFKPFFSHNFMLGLEQDIKMSGWSIEVEGGAFWALNNNSGLDKGNMDRAIQTWLGFDNTPDFYSYEYESETVKGFYAGLKFVVDVNDSMGVFVAGRYFQGEGDLTLTAESESVADRNYEFEDAVVDYTGIDFSIGVVLYGK